MPKNLEAREKIVFLQEALPSVASVGHKSLLKLLGMNVTGSTGGAGYICGICPFAHC